MTPPWMPVELFEHADSAVRGEDARDAVIAVNRALDSIDMGEYDGMIAFRQPKAIVFLPWIQHIHDQDCGRG